MWLLKNNKQVCQPFSACWHKQTRISFKYFSLNLLTNNEKYVTKQARYSAHMENYIMKLDITK